MIKTTRRVRMFVGQIDIRIQFEDQYGRSNRFFKDRDRAEEVYGQFIEGKFGAIAVSAVLDGGFVNQPGPPNDDT